MENLTIQKKAQTVSVLAATQAQVKEKYPDTIALMRGKDFFITIEKDAVKVAESTGIVLIKTHSGERQAAFLRTDLNTYLPKIVRAGHRIAIVDIINS